MFKFFNFVWKLIISLITLIMDIQYKSDNLGTCVISVIWSMFRKICLGSKLLNKTCYPNMMYNPHKTIQFFKKLWCFYEMDCSCRIQQEQAWLYFGVLWFNKYPFDLILSQLILNDLHYWFSIICVNFSGILIYNLFEY